uniref:C2H2-type domain-containing protein n=1 Tax=Salvator merianae TaxID=96440 RepID=A0A8D0KEU8_SALMN
MWWDWYRTPVTYTSSDSANSDNEEESDGEEVRHQRGCQRLTILRRNVRGNPKTCKSGAPLKKHPRSHLGRIKRNLADLGEAGEGATKVGQEYQYSCPNCGRAFKSKMSLSNHKRIHCEISSWRKMFPSKKAFASHQRSYAEERGYKHPNAFVRHSEASERKPFKCLECKKRFKWKYRLTEHVRSHTGERPHICPHCGSAFMRKEHLNRHQKIHTRKAINKSSEGREEKQETTHMRQDTSEVPEKMSTKDHCPSDSSIIHTAKNPSAGPTGKENVSNSSCLTQPTRNLRGKELYKCQYCEESFSEQNSLEKHESSHKSEKPYQCSECGKKFSQKRYLVQHEKTHRRQKNKTVKLTRSLRLRNHNSVPEKIQAGLILLPCRDSVREGVVTRSSSLTKRPKPLTEDKLYKCQYCGKCTKTKTSLISHEKIHRRKKPFQCLKCEKNFLHRKSLDSHQRSHLRKKLSKCSDLDKKNTTKNPPSPEHKISHRRKLPCFCFDCGKSFNNKYALQRHQRTHSKKKPFKCSGCGKGFIQTWHMKKHEKVHLKDEHPKKSITAEINDEFSNSTNGCLSEKPSSVQDEPQAISEIRKINTLQGVQEEKIEPQAVITESSGSEAAGDFEQVDISVKVPVKLCGKSKEEEVQNRLQEEIFVGQSLKAERKLGKEDMAVLQDKPCFGQQIQPRKCPRKTGLRRRTKEKIPARWLLRSQTMTRRKSKQEKLVANKQDKSCLCQRNGPEMIPRTKAKSSQGCKKIKASSASQKSLHATISPRLFKTVPNLSLSELSQETFSGEMQATGSAEEVSVSCAEQEMELQEALGTEAEGNSGLENHRTEKEVAADMSEQAEPPGMPLILEESDQQNFSIVQTAEMENVTSQNLRTVSVNQQPEAEAAESGTGGRSSPRKNCEEERGCNGPQTMPVKSKRTVKKDGMDNDCKPEKTHTKHTCGQCQRSFKSQGGLLIHEKTHIENRLFVCTQCDKKLSNVAALKVHMRIHTGERPFKCSKCEFRCNAISILNRHHKKIHSPKKPFPCQRCGKSFWFSHGLIIHLKTHSKKSCYNHSSFIHKSLLKLHSRCKHLEPVELTRSSD